MAVTLYHVSEKGKQNVLHPFVPKLHSEIDYLEEANTARLSFCPTIDQAIIASHIHEDDLPKDGKVFSVYSPLRDKFKRIDNDYLHRDKKVADARITDVLWCLDSIQVIEVAQIRIYPEASAEFLYVPSVRNHELVPNLFHDKIYLMGYLLDWEMLEDNHPLNKEYQLNDFATIISNETPSMEAVGDGKVGSDIKVLFDDYFSKINFDRNFIRKILIYVNKFETKNEEHINLLGSNLLGIYKIKFGYDDESEWIDDVLGIEDWEELTDEFRDIEEVTNYGVVGQSPVNMSFIYLTHRIMNSKSLSNKDKEAAALAVIKMLHYKFLASLLNHFFPYKTQYAIALALYEGLSKKSLLKKHHSWGGLVLARSEDVISSDSIHYKTINSMDDNLKCLYVVTDIQSRIREVVKKLTREYNELLEEDSKILAESKFLNIDGERTIRDFENNTKSLIRNMINVFEDKHDFIREELVDTTLSLVTTADRRHLLKVLEYIPEAKHQKNAPEVEEMIRSLIIYIHDYQRTSGGKVDIATMLVKLRNMYRSSQLSNKDIIFVRDVVSEIVDNVISAKHNGIVSSTRIASLVYITLRILAYKHYS